MTRNFMMLAGAAFGAVFGVSGAQAQSAYGCANLDDGSYASVLEGRDGVFYRIQPDLDAHHNISTQAVADVAALSRALAAQGTTLVYVPTPTKALGWPKGLGPGAADYGYDLDIATTVYDDAVRRLRAAGVVTVDARHALVAGGTMGYFATDPRLNADGSRRVAQAVAAELTQVAAIADLPRSTFVTSPQGEVAVPSADHTRIQRACLNDLPQPMITAHATLLSQRATGAVAGTGLFGAQAGADRPATLTAVGTEMTGLAEANFAGFLAEFTGIEAQGYSVPGGGAFAAISSYLTSTAFQTAPPRVLVWEVPVQHNLGQYGDQPMAELLAAAQGPAACRTPLTAFATGGPDIRVDLGPLNPTQRYTLYLDAGDVAASEARFTFTNRQGLTRTRSIARHPAQVATGRFYLPMTGLWREGAAHVDIRTDAGFGPTPRVVACLEQEGT